MGLIGSILTAIFGDGRNVIRETAEVFRENAEAGAARDLDRQAAALAQFAAEFQPRRGWFDAMIDGLNRLPRPMLALGTIGLIVAAMVDPGWFAERMAGLALVPEPLWWLMGAVVSFYFGARHQTKGQQFQREIAGTLARAPQPAPRQAEEDPNPALDEWRRSASARPAREQ
ncbi:holin family protein [Pseudooceanicola sp.]|uniref:holin family protein n=1 Tax=Pseudooceanicola sp. TaxID=1914328 RepID=UPI00405809ED